MLRRSIRRGELEWDRAMRRVGGNGSGENGYCDEDEEGQEGDADVCGRDAVVEAADERID
jgi:hypothetical protein